MTLRKFLYMCAAASVEVVATRGEEELARFLYKIPCDKIIDTQHQIVNFLHWEIYCFSSPASDTIKVYIHIDKKS